VPRDLGLALMVAARCGCAEVCSMLLEGGADLHGAEGAGSIALASACLYGHVSVVRCLLQYSAHPELTDERGRNAFHLACCSSAEIVRDLLGSNRNLAFLKDDQGRNPLFYAMGNSQEEGKMEVLKHLLEVRCSAREVDVFGRSALYYAARSGHMKVVALLQQAVDEECPPEHANGLQATSDILRKRSSAAAREAAEAQKAAAKVQAERRKWEVTQVARAAMAEEERKSREVAEGRTKAFEREAEVAEVRRVQEVAEAGRAAARAEEARHKREAAKFARAASATGAEAEKAQKAEEAAKASRALGEHQKFKAALAVLPAVRMAEDRAKGCELSMEVADDMAAEADSREARSPAERLETIAAIAADLVTQINNLRLESAVAPAAQDAQLNHEADSVAKEDSMDTQPPLPPPSLPPNEPLLPAPAEPPKEDVEKQDEERKDDTESAVQLVADAAAVEEEGLMAKEEATEAESSVKEEEPGKLEAPRRQEAQNQPAMAEAAEAEKDQSKQEAPPASEAP
ncbi:ANK3, partial [Symbiodinium microadriaticum]